MISGYGPYDAPAFLSAFQRSEAPKGGLAAPLEGPIASAPAPAGGGGLAQGAGPAACIVNSGQKLETPKNDQKTDLVMVGSGDECEPGGWVVRAVCPKCGHHVQLVKHGCGHITCPSCSKKWARRAAERSAARLWGAIHAGVSRWKPRHISFELPELSWDAAKKRAVELGCTGGVLVLHPWRLKDGYRSMFEIMAARTGLNRYDIAKQSGIGMDAFEYSPHCHGMVYGRFKDVEKGSKKYEYRNIRRLNSQHAAEGSLLYLFGHTSVPQSKNGKCYRYFGICSPQRLKPEWTGTCTDSLKCPECGAEMVEEGTCELILYKRYIALGWHIIRRAERRAREAAPPVKAPCVAEACNPFARWAVPGS